VGGAARFGVVDNRYNKSREVGGCAVRVVKWNGHGLALALGVTSKWEFF